MNLIALVLLTCFRLLFSASYVGDLEFTTNGLLCTTIGVGVPIQSFKVLIDTINNGTASDTQEPVYTWVLSNSAIPSESTLSGLNTETINSGCYIDLPGTQYNYEYDPTPLLASDSTINNLRKVQSNITFGDYTTDDVTFFGLKQQSVPLNFYINESVTGVLMMDYSDKSIMSLLKEYKKISTKTALINAIDMKVEVGDFGVPTLSNITTFIKQNISLYETAWVFPITNITTSDKLIWTNENCTNCYGVIDLSNNKIGYAPGSAPTNYKAAFGTIFKTDSGCDPDTGTCVSQDTVNYISFQTSNGNSFQIFGSDLYRETTKEALFEERYSNENGDTFIFLGYPFLKNVYVSLDGDSSAISISYPGSVSYNHWIGVIIIVSCIVGFALIFFVIFFYYNKVPRSEDNPEHQTEVLGSQNPNDNSNIPINNGQQYQKNIQGTTYQEININDDSNNIQNQNQMLLPRNPRNPYKNNDTNNNNNNNNNNNDNNDINNNKSNKSKPQSGIKLGGIKKLTPQQIKQQRLAKLQANMGKQESNE